MKKILYMIGIAALAMTSCSKENDNNTSDNDNRITFGSTIEATTRAIADNATQFAIGDKIGVIGYRADVAGATTDFSAPFMDKAEFTYGSSKFTSTSTDAFWQRGKAHNFYAYYPSDLAINTLTTAAPTATLAVTADTGIAQDVMQAKAETAAFDGTSNSATLAFIHSLSKVKFLVKKEANTPESKLTKVEFTMANNSGSFNVATGAVTNSGSSVVLSKTDAAQEITTTAASAFGAEWIVLPADVISDVKLTINGQELSATGLTGTTTVVGKITTITINVKAVGIELTSSITPWVEDNKEGEVGGPPPPPQVGDYYYSNDTYSTAFSVPAGATLLGVVYEANGNKGKLVDVTEGTSLAWGPEGTTTNAINTTDGQANMATIKALDPNFSDYPAFKHCANKTTGGVTDWYLPAKDELSALYTVYNTYGAGAFNALMTASGVNGTVFGSNGYWSSSEFNSYNSWYADFGTGYTSYSTKTIDGLVRCVRAF